MTGFTSKRRIALDRLDDDDTQIYAQPEGKIMTKDEALTLEALKYAASMGYPSSMLKDRFAPFTIKEAQAQPEQEPVAYCYVQKGTSVDILTFDDAPDDAVDGTIFPLYTAPPKPEQESEPDELTVVYMSGVFEGRKLEREACAKVCEKVDENDFYFGSQYAEAIRARGNTNG